VALPFPVSHLGENNKNNIPRQKMGGIEKKKKNLKLSFTRNVKLRKNLLNRIHRDTETCGPDIIGGGAIGVACPLLAGPSNITPSFSFLLSQLLPKKGKKKEERKSSLAAAQEPRTDGPRLGCAGRRVVNCGAACQFHKKARPFKLLISRSCVRVCCECVYACVVDVCMYQCVCVNGA
jgi:hypothetical protein